MDTIMLVATLWVISGLIPALMQMLARGRRTYYVDPWEPLWGAIGGPFTLWTIIMRWRRKRV